MWPGQGLGGNYNWITVGQYNSVPPSEQSLVAGVPAWLTLSRTGSSACSQMGGRGGEGTRKGASSSDLVRCSCSIWVTLQWTARHVLSLSQRRQGIEDMSMVLTLEESRASQRPESWGWD